MYHAEDYRNEPDPRAYGEFDPNSFSARPTGHLTFGGMKNGWLNIKEMVEQMKKGTADPRTVLLVNQQHMYFYFITITGRRMALTAQIDLKLPISLIRSTVLERLRQNGLYFLRARVVPPRTLKVNKRDVRILIYAILFPYLPTKAGCLCVAEIDGEEPLQFQELVLGSNYLAANDFMINFKRNIVTSCRLMQS